VNAYNTPVEEAALKLIAAVFPEDEVENPNQPQHQAGYKAYQERTAKDRDTHKGMNYFFDEVLPNCGGCIAMPFLDGRMGLGVAGEAKWFVTRQMATYGMFPKPKATAEQLEEFILNPSNGLFRIRELSINEKKQLLLMDEPQLVLGHQETRLRTWLVYNKERRPYATAHEAQMSVPAGFYPA
jgi:hypothetical protein